MLLILSSLVDAIINQAKKDHPIETCGLIAGPQKTGQPLRIIPMYNHAQSTTYFEFEPKQQLHTWREMDMRDEVPVVIYHSHTSSPAYPSHTDRTYAMEPNAHYVIVSTSPEKEAHIRSFRIIHGDVTEERIVLVPSYNKSLAS